MLRAALSYLFLFLLFYGGVSVYGSNCFVSAPDAVYHICSSPAGFGDCCPGYYCSFPGNSIWCQPCQPNYFAQFGAATCSPCAQGMTTFNLTAQATCQPCPAGSYSVSGFACQPCAAGYNCSGGVQTPCAPGTYSGVGSSVCSVCAAGSYSVGTSSFCQSCSIGTYSNTTGRSSCSLCPAGSAVSSAAGSTACNPCKPGHYSDGNGGSVCSACSPGMFAPSAGNTSCSTCLAGSYAGMSGSSRCTQCEAGKATAATSQTLCIQCPPGMYSSSLGLSSCLNCTAGTFTALVGSTICSSCPTALSVGAVSCVTCQPGYHHTNESSFCQPCSAGSFSPVTDSTSCILCQPGSYSLGGFSFCMSCSPGTFNGKFGQSQCVNCLPGTVSSNLTSSSSCTECDSGTYSDGTVATAQCLVCAPGTYSLANASVGCAPCSGVAGAFCEKGAIVIAAGYWGYVTTASRLATLPCPVNLCLNSTLGTQCAPGRVSSPLCGQCLPGFSEWNGECIDCTQSNSGIIVLFVLLAFIYVLIVHITSQSKSASGMIGMFLYFVQTALLIAGAPANWLQWLAWLNFTPQDSSTSSTPCPANLDAYQQMSLSILVSTALFVLLAIISGAHAALYYIRPSLPDGVCHFVVPFSFNSYIRTSVSLFLFSYSQVSTTVLRYLHCVDGGNGIRVVFTNPAINCASATYQSWLPFVIVLLIIDVIGAPIVIAIFLWYNRAYFTGFPGENSNHDNNDKNENKNNSTITSRSLDFENRWGILYEPYAVHTHWWHMVVLLRRATCVVLDTYIITQLQWKMLGFSLLHFASLLVELHLRPFAAAADNRAAVVAYVLLIVLSSFLTANPPPYPDWLQVLISCLVTVPVCMFVLFWLYSQLWHRCVALSTSTSRNEANEELYESPMKLRTDLEMMPVDSKPAGDSTMSESVDALTSTSNPLRAQVHDSTYEADTPGRL